VDVDNDNIVGGVVNAETIATLFVVDVRIEDNKIEKTNTAVMKMFLLIRVDIFVLFLQYLRRRRRFSMMVIEDEVFITEGKHNDNDIFF
jgi:hypothetical protein